MAPGTREIRRRDRALTEADARDILARAGHGVLATVGVDGWPYAVPLNHVLAENVLYVHCAQEGHKLENIANEARVSYCAVAGSRLVPARLTTLYESAVVFGRAAVVTDSEERLRAFKLLGKRFCAGFPSEVEEEITKNGPRATVLRIDIERITGKAHRPKTTS